MWLMRARLRLSLAFCLSFAFALAALSTTAPAEQLSGEFAADAPIPTAPHRSIILSDSAAPAALNIFAPKSEAPLAMLEPLAIAEPGIFVTTAAAQEAPFAAIETDGADRLAYGPETGIPNSLGLFATRQQFGPQPDRAQLNLSLALAAPVIAGGLDVSFAQRASFAEDDTSERLAGGAEVRLGQRLEQLVGEHGGATWDKPSWYLYAASEGSALTWTPADAAYGERSALGYQERVEIGDLSAGVTMEAGGVQGSIAYLQREITNARIGSSDRTRSVTENYIGATLTVRR